MPKFVKSKLEATVAEFLKVKVGDGGVADFIRHATRYVSATREGRLLYNITKVAPSGLSRTVRITDIEKTKHYKFQLRNFHLLFESLGHKVSLEGEFKIYIICETHSQTIQKLGSLGFLSKTDTEKLAQNTPHLV